MYIVEIQQFERRHVLGVFGKEQDAVQWIESLPFVEKETYQIEEMTFHDYSINLNKMKMYEEVEYHRYIIPFTKLMFDPSESITIFYYGVHNFDHVADEPTYVDSVTQVDAYMIPNEEVKNYIIAREKLYEEIVHYFEGKTVQRGGVGSEDGEYILVDDQFLIHLDPQSVEERSQVTSIEEYVKQFER